MPTFGGRDYADQNRQGAPQDQGQGQPGPTGPQVQPPQQGNGYQQPPPQAYQQPPQQPYQQPQPPQGGGGYDRGRGGGQGGGSGYNRDPNYAFISYFYRAKNNSGGFTVFLKREMLEILRTLDEDDVLGISPSGNDGWAFYARRVPQQDKDAYRRGGGQGQGGGNRGGNGRGGRGRY